MASDHTITRRSANGVIITIKTNNSAIKEMTAGIADNTLLIGIPQSTNARDADDGNPITNAQILLINEFGSPAQNIPARPSLRPGVSAILPQAKIILAQAAKSEVAGKSGAMLKALNTVGLLAQNSVKGIIRARIPPDLAERTKRGRLERKGAYQKAGQVGRANMMAKWLQGNFTPLLDTGRLLNAITYVIRK